MTIAGMTFYQIAQYFLIYSCLGWVTEVIYQAVAKGLVVNRGFLNGPVCPIYGFGVVGIFALIHTIGTESGRMEDMNLWEIFLFGVILATAIELFGGWVLDKAFHARWWDYSNKPLNFRGYICLEFSIIWGMGIVFVVREVHPFIAGIAAAVMQEHTGWILMGILYLGYIADFTVSVLIMIGLNRRFAELDEMRRRMRVVSDGLSTRIGENTLQTLQNAQEMQVQTALAYADMRESVETGKREFQENMESRRNELEKRLEEGFNQQKERYEAVYQNAMDSQQKLSDEREFMLEQRKYWADEYERQKTEFYDRIRSGKHFGVGRMLRAFPDMRHHDYGDMMQELRERMQNFERKCK